MQPKPNAKMKPAHHTIVTFNLKQVTIFIHFPSLIL